METAWREDRDRAKFSINSLIGLCNLDESESYALSSSTNAGDAPPGSLMTQYLVNGRVWYDFVTSYTQKTCFSMKPLYDLCLATEARNMGVAIYTLKQFNSPLLEFKTDSIMFKLRKRRLLDITAITYKDLAKLRTRYCGLNKLNCYTNLTPNPNEEPIFRMHQAVESDYMKTDPARPMRGHMLAGQVELAWVEPDVDTHEDSLLILGPPGTGKSHTCLKIIERLRRTKRVEVMSKTWVASQRIGGVTADHWVQRYLNRGTPSIDYILIDEISQ